MSEGKPTESTPPVKPAAQPTKDEVTEPESGDEAARSPEVIKAEIAETREELGDTVAALAEKADVKAQAKKKATETKTDVQEKVAGATENARAKAQSFSGRAQEAAPESATAAATQARQVARDNPVEAATIGALLFGFVIGWLIARR